MGNEYKFGNAKIQFKNGFKPTGLELVLAFLMVFAIALTINFLILGTVLYVAWNFVLAAVFPTLPSLTFVQAGVLGVVAGMLFGRGK